MVPTEELPQLVERLQRRDQSAETEFYHRFGPRVAYLARRELRSAMEADDVQSETLMRALEAVRGGRLRAAEALPSFVLQIARNVIHERARQTRRFVPIGDADSATEPVAPAIEPPDPAAAKALQGALLQMNDRDRAFLRMHYYDDLSREEIARRLGIAEERVRLVRSRALQRFREAFNKVTSR